MIPSSLIWNTTNKTISQIQIDFADGNGLQTITIGSPITITYTDTGYKRWTVKTTLSDNTVLQCYNEYYVHKVATIGARFATSQTVVPTWGFVAPVNGVHSGAIVTVNYSRLNNTNTLRKPLIVVEGYDVSRRASSLQNNYDIAYFINRQLPEANTPTWDFNNQLDDIAGYDLVFIDFADGADDIVRNAAIVQEVINRVNANKVNDTRFGNIRQQNVVMGLSMGGLCARFALANMTKNFPGTPTETRLLITHDSPHRGANVPLGLQYMIRMLGGVQLFNTNVTAIYPQYDDAINLMNAPATTQLLLYSATSANAFTSNAFLDATYRPMITFAANDPQPTYRFIATANGNECANPLFNPSKTFINIGAGVSAGINAKFFIFKIPIVSYKVAAEIEAYALPNAGSTNKIARVYTINNLKLFGLIDIFKELYDNTAYAPGTHLAVDGVPGSNYPLINLDALDQITSLPNFSANLSFQIPIIKPLSFYFDAYAYNQGVAINFTFVPVGSALDVSPYTTPVFSQKYVNGTNQNYPSTSETFIAQETVQNNPSQTNSEHLRFTARNSQWLFNEMENLNNNLNCSNECSNPYYISGNNIICTNSTYFIPGLPRGATVSWTATPTGIVSIGTTNNIATVSKTANGVITLTATINNACGGNVSVSKQDIVIGTGANIVTFTQAYITCLNSKPYFYGAVQAVPAATNYTWYSKDESNSNNPFVLRQSMNSNTADFPLGNNKGNRYYTIRVIATNPCGTIQTINEDGYLFAPNCTNQNGLRLATSPNPTANTLQLEIVDDAAETTTTKTASTSVIEEIRVINKLGQIKKTIKGSKLNKLLISIADLPKDVYTILVYDGNTWLMSKVIKN